MYYAYVLKSNEHDYYYKGHCKEVDLRLQQHNSGMTGPFDLIFHLKLFIHGGFKDEFEMVKDFLGREPDPAAFFRSLGL
ncbi:MAG: Excinuclease subunit domain protein [Segetibacter sp.]|nr:Excinuclease subunit domain protein [Segetibacter sp.]